MLLQHFHGDAMAQVMRLQLGVADDPTVHLAEPPDVLAGHRWARVLPTTRRPQVDQNNGVSGATVSMRESTRCTYVWRNFMTTVGRGMSRPPGCRRGSEPRSGLRSCVTPCLKPVQRTAGRRSILTRPNRQTQRRDDASSVPTALATAKGRLVAVSLIRHGVRQRSG